MKIKKIKMYNGEVCLSIDRIPLNGCEYCEYGIINVSYLKDKISEISDGSVDISIINGQMVFYITNKYVVTDTGPISDIISSMKEKLL